MIDKKDIEKLNRFSKGLTDSKEEKYIYSLFAKHEDDIEFKKHLRMYVSFLSKHPFYYLL